MIRHFAWVSAPLLLLLGSHARANLEQLASAYHFVEHKFPAPDDSGRCGRAANPTAKLAKVRFAQTHLMEPSWPLFYLAGGRPALIAVNLAGTGNSPDVRMTAKVKGVTVGTACLSGPETIPAAGSDATPSLSTLYSMTLPKEWMVPGLSVVVEAGTERKEFTSRQLPVRSPTEVNLLMARFEFPGLDNPALVNLTEPKDLLANLAVALPSSVTRLGHFPVALKFDKMLYPGNNNEPVLWCSDAAVDRKYCHPSPSIDASDFNETVYEFTEMLSRATGHYYMGGYIYARAASEMGGISKPGARVAEGTGWDGTFLHEMGHSMELLHWHQAYNMDTVFKWDLVYPYGGPKGNGGGRGGIWNWDANTREFISPNCQYKSYDDGLRLERKDEMSYLGLDCPEAHEFGPGPWAGFSEYSAFVMHQFLNGQDSTMRDSILDRDTMRLVQVRDYPGEPSLESDAAGNPLLVRRETQPPPDPMMVNEYYWNREFLMSPKQEKPVYLVYGTCHQKMEMANVLYKPIPLVANAIDLIDPTNPKIFADMKKYRLPPYYGNFSFDFDITLRMTYADGSKRVGIYPHSAAFRYLVDDTTHWTITVVKFALLVPADKPLAKVEVLRRYFTVGTADDTTTGNINATGSKITAENFLDDAKLLFERSFDDVMPPTGIDIRPRREADLEKLGGHVTVRGLDGRIVGEFALEAGASLDRRAREVVNRRGVWLVHLKNASGAVSRNIAIQ